ncbi:MAG TPA: thioredoxin domain-containing protein [Gammaproteobacteria bacterium]|nr:thioredoxin domain-containing protein [Gammaproteobacteria bacterium]
MPPANHLLQETSPYLLQHAHNPVDWHPWNEAALKLARDSGKPILLSIGYSACHWCHVMAHESFEDADTAALMNRLFVNIKVDREERPDLDRVYQLAHQILARRGGGWPLTVFLDPDDLVPFFAGTYFPRTPRYGSPAFSEVLTRVAAFFNEHKAELHQQNAAVQDVFKRIRAGAGSPADSLDDTPLTGALHALARSFDARFGGFGGAPKFPHPATLEFLLRESLQPDDSRSHATTRAREMLETTLTRMAEGGIHDQLGGGFCRYAVDAQWTIPHFEKMLYDNGPLLALYALAAKLDGNSLYTRTAHGLAGWIMREMQAPEGGYWSSLDADSEGHEGRFYVWSREEVRGVLSEAEYAVFAPRYGLDQPPNFERQCWHLCVRQDIATIATNLHHSEAETETLLEAARSKLLVARGSRVRPGLDDKVLTAWNGLMIRGMALAGRLLETPAYLDSAQQAMHFLRNQLWRNETLSASWRAGQARLPAYLDDYAFLLDGALELLQARWDSGLFGFAQQLADALLARFEDKPYGGFWFTAEGQPIPLHRSKTFSDESLPTGNAIAARALFTLGHLAAEPRYLDAAERTLKAATPGMRQQPDAHAAMLLALRDALEPPEQVILRGTPTKLAEWQAVLLGKFDPRRRVLAIPDDAGALPGLLAYCVPHGEICAYRCRGTECGLPITRLDALTRP